MELDLKEVITFANRHRIKPLDLFGLIGIDMRDVIDFAARHHVDAVAVLELIGRDKIHIHESCTATTSSSALVKSSPPPVREKQRNRYNSMDDLLAIRDAKAAWLAQANGVILSAREIYSLAGHVMPRCARALSVWLLHDGSAGAAQAVGWHGRGGIRFKRVRA